MMKALLLAAAPLALWAGTASAQVVYVGPGYVSDPYISDPYIAGPHIPGPYIGTPAYVFTAPVAPVIVQRTWSYMVSTPEIALTPPSYEPKIATPDW